MTHAGFLRPIAGALLPVVVLFSSCGAPAEGPEHEGARRASAPGPRAQPAVAPPEAPSGAPAEATAPAPATPAAEASGTFYLGRPVVSTMSELETKRWAQEGGGIETLRPAAGSTFVVVQFPEASRVTFTSTELSLRAGGESPALAPYAVTSPSANPIQPRSSDPGPAMFQREVFMFVDWEPGPNTPFAIAFEVPAASGSGVLRIKDVEATIRW